MEFCRIFAVISSSFSPYKISSTQKSYSNFLLQKNRIQNLPNHKKPYSKFSTTKKRIKILHHTASYSRFQNKKSHSKFCHKQTHIQNLSNHTKRQNYKMHFLLQLSISTWPVENAIQFAFKFNAKQMRVCSGACKWGACSALHNQLVRKRLLVFSWRFRSPLFCGTFCGFEVKIFAHLKFLYDFLYAFKNNFVIRASRRSALTRIDLILKIQSWWKFLNPSYFKERPGIFQKN